MGLFGRKKSTPPPAVPAVPGVPADAMATGDFEVVVRALASQMSGHPVVEEGNDTIAVGNNRHYLGNLRAGWENRPAGEREIYLRNALHGFHKSELRNMDTLDTSMLRPGIRSQWTANLMLLMTQQHSPGAMPDAGAETMGDDDGTAMIIVGGPIFSPETQAKVDELAIEERAIATATWECEQPIADALDEVRIEYELRFVEQYGDAVRASTGG